VFIRSHTWGKADLSWSRVMERLLQAADEAGNSSLFISTNGYDGMERWTQAEAERVAQEQSVLMRGRPHDIDITYSIPRNYPTRFLPDSRVKIGRYDYESSELPEGMKKFLDYPDYLVGSSDFVLDIFARAGANPLKLRKIPSGVDRAVFSPTGPKLNLKKMGYSDPFVFLCIAEPHYRKQIDRLIDIYCSRFTAADNTLLLIKTKFPTDNSLKFEMDIRPHLAEAQRKYGAKMPAIKVIQGFLKDVGPLYRSAHAFVLPTVGEGWGMPFLEALACGTVVIAPRYSGQLEFLNDSNSMLCPVDICQALPQEQYGAMNPSAEIDAAQVKNMPKGVVGRPVEAAYGDLMKDVFLNHKRIKASLAAGMEQAAEKYSWAYAAKKMTELA